jgi:hypothetical protein
MKGHLRDLLIAGLILPIFSTALWAQVLNPTYLSQMPAPARVLAEIKGKDAEDTTERQMGAFQTLVDIIDDMAYGIGHRYVSVADNTKATPDEKRIRLAYQTAYADLWKKAAQKDTYTHNRELLTEILSKLFSDDFRRIYAQSNQNAAAAIKAVQDRMYSAPPAIAPTQQHAAVPATTGPAAPGSTAEMRRCVASGRTLRMCMSESIGGGFTQLLGIDLSQLTGPAPVGLRMTGDYATADGFRLIFEPDQVTMVCRGVPGQRPYSVKMTDTQATVTIENDKPLVVTLRADGKLAGSGPVRVTGQVPAGTRTEQTMGTTTQTTTTTRELTPLEAGQYQNARQNGQMYTVQQDSSQLVYGPTGTRTVTNFTTKTTDCTVSVLSPIGASPLQQVKNDADILTTIGAGMGALMKGGNLNDATKEMIAPEADQNIAPGLRMAGSYGGGSFGLNFHRESVTMACGDAEQALPYAIQRSGGKTLLVIEAKPNPLSLQVMPDESINGSGNVQVNGRIITGTTDDVNNPFTFAPHVASCAMGRLTAGTPITIPVSTASSPVAPSAAAATTPASASANGTAVTGSTSLRISAGPGVAKLLAGKALAVLRDSLENVLAAGGITPQGTTSRVAVWAHACERAAADPVCQQGLAVFGNYTVARTGFDASGVATFTNVPSSGTFYLVADTSYTNHLLWSVRIDLKPGANTIILDERNMTPLR